MGVKSIQISIDSGTTFRTLPGNSGELSNDAGSIDDTIFGQNFKSSQTGLINWTVKANGFYKGFAGYVAKIKKSGSTTAFTGEAMSLVSGKTYKITDATKNVWDRTVTPTIYDNAVDHTADVLSIDFLFGRVTFKSAYTPTGPITADGSYFPMTQVAKAQEFTLTQTTNPIDTTDFETAQGNSGNRAFEYGLQTVALDLSGVYATGNGYLAALQARGELVIDINPDGSELSVARGFFKPMSQGQSGNVGALEKETNKFELSVPSTPDTLQRPFGWVHASGTTLNQSVQDALTAWEGLTTVQVKYLADGTHGATGDAIMSDLTLKGGLESMNDFTVNFQGTGEATIL